MIALVAVVSALALSWIGHSDTYSEPWHQSVALAASGEVEIDNLYGDAHIEQGPAGSVEIDALKKANAPGDLSGIQIHVDAVQGAVKISTDYPASWRGLHRVERWVDYRIRVPHGTKVILRLKYGDGFISSVGGPVDAETRYGDMEVRGASGEDSVSSEYGDVALSVKGIGPLQHVTMHTVYGNVNLDLPPGSAPRVAARTKFGSVDNDFGTAQGTGPSIDLKTTFGDVTVRKVNP